MDRDKIIKVGYFFSPQDRRRVGEKMMHEYVLEYFRKIHGKDLFGESDESGRTIVFHLLHTDKETVLEEAKKLWTDADLNEQSFYTVVELEDTVTGAPADTEHPARNEQLVKLLKKVDRLVGVESLKKLCHAIVAISESPEAGRQREYFSHCAILFSISGGDGFTEYVELIRKVLKRTGTKEITGSGTIKEVKKAEPYEAMLAVMEDDDYDDELVAFDLTYKVEKADEEEFRDFIRQMRRRQGSKLPVFKIPYSEGEEKANVIRAISAVFPLIVIDVPPFTTEQYSEYAMQVLAEMGYEVEDVAHDEIRDLIVQKRNREHFYGFHSVLALAEEIVFQKTRSEIRREEDMSLVIREQDLVPMIEKSRAEQGGLDALDEMVGMEEVRERIDEILVQLEIAAKLPMEERPCMHMLFTGNPGTGKTTVARILGKALKERNVLSRGQFFERTGREFVGKYIGETAPITNAICRDAYGSVLFVDEAYTLYRSDDERDFGKEALDTLLTQMENHRQDLIVILSGYGDKMKEMLDANPGLKSRIPHEIKFRNFTQQELYMIYMNMAKRTYSCAKDLGKAAKAYFMDLSQEQLDTPSFSNARFVRNLYERTVSKAALRVQAASGGRIEDTSLITLTGEDFRKASASEEFTELLKKKSSLGFV